MLKYLLEKEFKQILRNKFLSKLIFVLPVTTIVIFPFVTNQDVQDVKLAVVDQDHSPPSIGKAGAESVRFGLLPPCRRVAHLRGGDAEH